MLVTKLVSISFLFVVFLIPFDLPYVESTFQGSSNNHTKTFSQSGLNMTNLTYDRNSNPFNISYSDWTAKWWQWAYSIPQERHPSYDDSGKFCGENQKKPVWYLSNSYEFPVIRTCEIPSDTAILVPLLNSECSYAEFPMLKTEQELRECVKDMQDTVGKGHAFLDGVNLSSLIEYRLQTDLFNFTIPQNNILNLTSQTTKAVADGNWLFLKPLHTGTFELKIKGDINSTALINKENIDANQYAGPIGWNQTTTYILKVN